MPTKFIKKMNAYNNQPINQYGFQFPLQKDDFLILESLGGGAFGKVDKVKYRITGKIYALKKINKSSINNYEKEKDYLREKKILYDVTKKNFPYVVKLYADFEDNIYKYLVMEFSEGIGLDKLRGNQINNGLIDQNLVIHILTQLLETLKFLHDTCNIIHRDIKPDNIVLGKDNNIKLLDFGLAAYMFNQDQKLVSNKSIKGAIRYVPPEIIFYPLPLDYDFKIDIFSLGFTIYSIMNPSNGKKTNLPQETEGRYGNIRRYNTFKINTFYDIWLVEFVHLLYENDKNKRPTAAEALGMLKNLQTNPNFRANYNNLKIKNKQENILRVVFRRETFTAFNNNYNPLMNNYNNIPRSLSQINLLNNYNNINNDVAPYPNIQRNYNRYNTVDLAQKMTEVEEFLRPEMGKENRIKSSMKCLLLILYKLDKMKYIKAQIHSIYTNSPSDYHQFIMYSFHKMLDSLEMLDKKQINNMYYDQLVNNFITKIFINNKSEISGARPIILFYMMTHIINQESKDYFKNVRQNGIFNDIIKNKLINFKNIVPIQIPNIYDYLRKNIIHFVENYKGPFVENFNFLVLKASNCPECNNCFGISEIQIGLFLQLDVVSEVNDIQNLINNYFTPTDPISDNKKSCNVCGCKNKKKYKKYCLNLPNYMFLELEDKNIIKFLDQISIPLYDGNNYIYQFYAGIYKNKVNGFVNFIAVLKEENKYYLYNNDRLEKCEQNFMNLPMPSLALYKKMKV